MRIDKHIELDLAHVRPYKIIHIHENDLDSVFVVLTITNEGEPFSLSGLSVKYDAVIADYLAEQDADGEITGKNMIVIPVTENMTALDGTLKIDVRMLEGSKVLHTQTISLIVEKSIVDGSVKIDFDGINLCRRLNTLEADMASIRSIIDSGTIKYDIPDVTAIAEAEGWTDTIPTTFAGELYDLVAWDGYIWELYGIVENGAQRTYNWDCFMTRTDVEDMLPVVPTKVSQLQNDAGYLTAESIANKADKGESYTKAESDAKYLTTHQDISGKADKATTLAGYSITDAYTKMQVNGMIPTVPTNVSAFTNDAGYLTAHQDISGKVDKTRKVAGVDLQDDITAAELKTALSVPAKTSDLTNDSGFITNVTPSTVPLVVTYADGTTETLDIVTGLAVS